MRFLQVALLAAPIALLAAPAIAQPACYMIDTSGRMIDLSRMCNRTAPTATPTKSATNLDKLISVATLQDGRKVYWDEEKSSQDKFVLSMLTSDKQGLIEIDYGFACRERRAFEQKVSYYKNGTLIESAGAGERPVVQDSAITRGMELTCKKIMSPGY
ncbi:hypothetical protein [Leptodesmis sichuanensis]|uniref:hypothetical protein n=1 Tax=Leptodesmis sichuanensis TaxID=2906798 RepID=UPI001F21331E|nr:hypothetical protein [Leptodesmis sichuanensis]UIE36007.1 hypothetical protein KIK02_12995 [Leptodesmis sichuanensis A121]